MRWGNFFTLRSTHATNPIKTCENHQPNNSSNQKENDMNNINVMIVDDHPLESAHVCRIFQDCGINQTFNVNHISDAINIIKRENVDLLICDILMPNGGGAKLISQLHNLLKQQTISSLPILVWLSSMNKVLLHSHTQLAYEANFRHVNSISKPFNKQNCMHILSHVKNVFSLSSRSPSAPTAYGFKEQEIIEALFSKNSISIALQPQVRLADRKIVGAEALARCRHPILGNIAPDVFLPIINKLGLDLLLFFHVLSRIIATQQVLARNGVFLPIAINASASTLISPSLTEEIIKRWDLTGLPRSLLVIELTENVELEHGLDLMVALNQLRANGFAIACDDYGIGISTLKIVSRMPFTELKLDREFVAAMQRSAKHREIVRSSILLGKKLKLKIIAEGIEDEACADSLLKMGCEIGQGFGLHFPMPPEKYLEHILHQHEKLEEVAEECTELVHIMHRIEFKST